jgi:Ca2+-transporting ATPase
LLQGQYFQGVFLFVWGGVLIAPSDNLIRTLFMSGRAGRIYIPPLVIILGLLGGLSVFGFIGIVLGPLILSLLFSVLELFTREPPATRPTTHP